MAPSADAEKWGHTMRRFKHKKITHDPTEKKREKERERKKDIKRREPDRIGGVRRRRSRGVAVDVVASATFVNLAYDERSIRQRCKAPPPQKKEKKHNQ